MPISAVIITFNEARHIARCIQALQGVADEVVVVDSYSTDDTAAIAEDLGAKVILHPFHGYGEQKNVAIAAAKHDWLLNVDADEALSPELRASILAVKDRPEHDAYSFNFLTNYCGHWVRHGGWYPNPKNRFWNRHKGYMTDDKVHEAWILNEGATSGFLKGDILHYSFPTISSHLKKVEQYSEYGARFDVMRGKKVSLLKLLFAPKWTFISMYLFRGGFRDGYYGWVIAKNSAYAAFAKYLKIRQYSKMSAEERGF
jgi:glycosyltransferase involved in cell wall biosynthesis